MAIELRLLIGSDRVNYSGHVNIASSPPTASDEIEKNQNKMRFSLYLRDNDGVPVPRAGQEVIWVRWDTYTNTEAPNGREFAGVLEVINESYDGLNYIYDCECASYLKWFDRQLVEAFFQQGLAEDRIRDVVNNFTVGFTTNGVSAPITVVTEYSQWQRPSNVIKKFVESIGYGWYIDYYKDVKVFERNNFLSPLTNNQLNADTDFSMYSDLVLSEDSTDLFNYFVIRGYKERSETPLTLNFKGDGATTQFSLGYRISSEKNGVTVKINGVSQVVKRDVLEGIPGRGGDPGTAYIHYTQHLVRFVTPPANGSTIEVTCFPLIDKTYENQDSSSVKYVRLLEGASNSDGVYQYAETLKSLVQNYDDDVPVGTPFDAVLSRVNSLAEKYSFPIIRGSMTTYIQGWKAGQSFTFKSSKRMGGIFSSGEDRMYVYRVTKKWLQPFPDAPAHVAYIIEFANIPYTI